MPSTLQTFEGIPAAEHLTPRPIRSVGPRTALAPAASSSDSVHAVRPYVNDARNARVPLALPGGPWEVRWKTELAPGSKPGFIMYARRRVLVQGTYRWQLFDLAGTPLETGAIGYGEVALDPDAGVFYLGDPNALVRAQHLADGTPAYALFARFGDTYARAFIARRGDRLLIASVEVEGDPHGTHEPENAVVEVQYVGEPVEVDENGFLRSSQRLANVIFDTVDIELASVGEHVVVAVPNELYALGFDLQVQQVLDGSFTPLAMSLDETRAAHLVVHTVSEEGVERYALWVVTPDGERVVDAELPEPEEEGYAPPTIGYDHHIYLAQGDSLYAFSPAGERLWTKHGGGPITGMVATADHCVLVAGGGWLSAFDASGERTVVFMHDETWATPPILTEHGDILIATEHHLYRLTQKQ